MTRTNQLRQFIAQNNGFITRKQVVAAGHDPSILYRLVKGGELERSTSGVFIQPHLFDDYFYNYGARYQRGIFSLNTSLFLHDMTDRMPISFDMAFPLSYGIANLPDGINASRESEKFYGIGREVVLSPSGNEVAAYNIERTMCDILRRVNKVDIQIVTDAFKSYSRRQDQNPRLLYEYAALLGVKQKVRNYMEVLT